MKSDRRQCFRVPVPEEQRTAILKVQGKSIPAELIDQSSLGFCINCEASTSIDIGQRAVLRTYSGEFIVLVARKSSEADKIELGLELIAVEEEDDFQTKTPLRSHIGKMLVGDKQPIVIGGFIVAMVAVFGFALANPFQVIDKKISLGRFSLSKKSSSVNQSTEDFSAPEKPKTSSGNIFQSVAKVAQEVSNKSTTRINNALEVIHDQPESSAANPSSMLTMLASPNIVQALRLNDFQKLAVDSAVRDCREQLRRIDANRAFSFQERQHKTQEAIEATTQRIKGLLNSEQRSVWQSLLGSSA